MHDKTLRDLTGYRLQRTTGTAMQRYKAVFAEFGLRRTTFSCLSLIIDNPGMRQGQLGEVLAIERPNLVQIVEDLLSRGLISRAPSETDRRAYALTPTEAGRALFARSLAAVQALDARMTQGLSPSEVDTLHSLLDRLQGNAEGPL